MSNLTLFTCDDEVVAIGRGLFDLTLPKVQWTHAAHVAAAVWVLTCRSQDNASAILPPAIRAYNEATGVANTDSSGYHETITQASIRATRALIAGSALPLFGKCNAILASPLGRSSWLLDYWSRPRLFSRAARKTWIEPDLRDLPF